eukprot:18783-Heterococcus_DN1.PRE.3
MTVSADEDQQLVASRMRRYKALLRANRLGTLPNTSNVSPTAARTSDTATTGATTAAADAAAAPVSAAGATAAVASDGSSTTNRHGGRRESQRSERTAYSDSNSNSVRLPAATAAATAVAAARSTTVPTHTAALSDSYSAAAQHTSSLASSHTSEHTSAAVGSDAVDDEAAVLDLLHRSVHLEQLLADMEQEDSSVQLVEVAATEYATAQSSVLAQAGVIELKLLPAAYSAAAVEQLLSTPVPLPAAAATDDSNTVPAHKLVVHVAHHKLLYMSVCVYVHSST